MEKLGKELLEKKILIVSNAIMYLERDSTYASWTDALQLGPMFRHHEDYEVAKSLHLYMCDAIHPWDNHLRWLAVNRPEETRSEKECLIEWFKWMRRCLQEDLQALEEYNRIERACNPITHPDGPHKREKGTIVIQLW